MTEKGQSVEALRKKYCPPLDDALFYALAADYDLSREQSRLQLVAALDDLKESAAFEQDLELIEQSEDLHQNDHVQAQDHENESMSSELRSRQGKVENASTQDSATSANTHLSQPRLTGCTLEEDESSDILALDLGVEGLELKDASQETKIQWLRHIFPSLSKIQVQSTLVKCQGDIHRVTDELLNLVFISKEDIHESGGFVKSVPKGVDGFAAANQSDSSQRKSRGGRKKPRKRVGYEAYDNTDSAPSSGVITPLTNVWQTASQDVDFIVSRTGLSYGMIKSIYHDNGAQLSKTVQVLIDLKAEMYNESKAMDVNVQLQMEELKFIFDDVPTSQLYGALLLGRNIPSAAEELLGAVFSARPVAEKRENISVIPQYTPLRLSDDETESKPKSAARMATSTPVDYSILLNKANLHSAAAHRAVGQASVAFKRGKSNPLYGGAAAYYASEYHDQKKQEKALLSSAADALVMQQSGSNYVDLHGINVEHGKRIARDKVEAWWEGLGDKKHRNVGFEEFKIITGVGTHSTQGRARLGPAISTMLINEGWKINVQRGEIFVEGKKSR